MRQLTRFLALSTLCILVGFLSLADEIRLPDLTLLSGRVVVVIADWFYKEVSKNLIVPRVFSAWPGELGLRDSDWYDVRIEAHPGDVIVLSAGTYPMALWVFTPGITITTDPDANEQAIFHGTVEIDADRVTLDNIAVIGARMYGLSGHGIEVNREVIDRIAIRNCRVEGNDWTGIHIIGPHGEIDELRIEDCQVIGNGQNGIDSQHVNHLIITGCTITGNGWNYDKGVGVDIGSYVLSVEMHDNIITQNRFADVYRKE